MTRVTLENLTKQFGKTTAVKDLNLKIKSKEFLVLLGPSGCGKTTTLRMIAGLEVPTRGHIYLDDKDVTYLHPKKRKVAMVFQNYALFPHMTVFENISFPLKIGKRPKEEIRKRVKEVTELLGIGYLLDKKPRTLSGGEAQRVALGRAIIREPEVFLMDEPLSNVDAKLRVRIRGELKKLQKELQITTVYVTHDQIEAMALADRVVILNEGELQQIDRPMDLYRNPLTSFVGGFMGTPPMNFIECSVVEKNGKILFDTGTFAVNVPDGADVLITKATSSKLLLGIRPENVIVKDKGRGDFTADVISFEPLGTETMVNFDVNGVPFRVRAPIDFKVDIGEKMGVTLDRNKIYLFDAKTGERIF